MQNHDSNIRNFEASRSLMNTVVKGAHRSDTKLLRLRIPLNLAEQLDHASESQHIDLTSLVKSILAAYVAGDFIIIPRNRKATVTLDPVAKEFILVKEVCKQEVKDVTEILEGEEQQIEHSSRL